MTECYRSRDQYIEFTDDDKSVASCQQTCCKLIVQTCHPQACCKLFQINEIDKLVKLTTCNKSVVHLAAKLKPQVGIPHEPSLFKISFLVSAHIL